MAIRAPVHVHPKDREEIRLAVVMTGGVSLAVWMGGVAFELDRLAARQTQAYARLLELTQSDVVIDVVSGTSAGGLNGALLAASTAYDRRLSELRRTWLMHGSISKLLRSPNKRELPSLLDGDGYFLPRLEEVFRDLRGGRAPREGLDLQLFMTAALLLRGRGEVFRDRFGNEMHEVTHLGQFVFRSPDFGREGVERQLALAARTSAAHPGGFEPSFIPVVETPDPAEPRPNMRGIANWRASRFAIDGGVLLNRPLAPALAAVFERAADREVRRLILFVAPDPGRPPEDRPDDPVKERPALSQTLMAVARLPMIQSIGDQLRQLDEHNARVRRQRSVRRELTVAGPRLETSARVLFGTYRSVRAERAAAAIVRELDPRSADERLVLQDAVTVAMMNAFPGELPAPGAVYEDPWRWGVTPIDRVVDTVLDWLRRALALTPPDPPSIAEGEPTLRGQLRLLRGLVFDVRDRARALRVWENEFWQSNRAELVAGADGQVTIARISELLEELPVVLAELDARIPPPWRGDGPPPPAADPRSELLVRAGLLLAAAAPVALRAAYQVLEAPADAPPSPASPTDDQAAAAFSLAQGVFGLADVAEADRPQRIGTALASWDRRAAEGSLPPLPLPPVSSIPAEVVRAERERLDPAPETMAGRAPAADPDLAREVDHWLARSMFVEIAQVPMLASNPAPDQEIELVQVSARVANALDERREPEDKLTGLQLAHFGAFYKMSWRANDWMWGRLDGAFHLAQVLLNPDRLRRLNVDADAALEAIEAIATAEDGPPELRAYLGADADERRRAVRAQLAYLDDPSRPTPTSLEAAFGWVARRLQLDVLLTELPWVARAVAFDMHNGGAAPEDARLFLNEYLGFPGERATVQELARRLQRDVLDGGRPLDEPVEPERAVRLFRVCRVGRERIADETQSDYFATTATHAAATAVAVTSGPRSGLGPAAGLIGTLRGVTLAIYAITRGITQRSRVWTALVAAAIFLGAAVLAMEILTGRQAVPAIRWVAIVLLGAGVVAAIVRTLWLFPVLAIVLATVSAFLILAIAAPARSIWGLLAVVVGVLLVVAVLDAGVSTIRAVRGWRAVARAVALVVAVAGVAVFLFLPIPFDARSVSDDCGSPVLGLRVRFPEAEEAGGTDGTDATCRDVQRDWEIRALSLVVVGAGALGVYAFRRRPERPTPPAGGGS